MSIDLSQFEKFSPPPKPSQLAINITASGFVNLNDKLRKKLLSTVVGLYQNKDGTQIVLKPQDEEPFKILKSGSIDAMEFTRKLSSKGIVLPARFEAKWDEDTQMWLGILIKPKKTLKSISVNNSKLKKPRTTGLKDMIS